MKPAAGVSAFALALVIAFAPVGSRAATYQGTASQPSVVWITGPGAAAVNNAAVRQTQKAFVPAVLVIPVKTAVMFPNDDQFYHSVYSASPGNPFDLGLYDTGPGKNVVFAKPGVIEVRCHVHGSMHATIVVVDGPYAMTTQLSEDYKLDVSRGPHVLHVWTDGSPVVTTPIVVK